MSSAPIIADSPDWSRVSSLLDQLYAVTDELEAQFPGRSFCPDGHLVGSIGEVCAAFMFDLRLQTASCRGYDATAADGRQVEIKFTQGRMVALRHEPQHLLALQRLRHGSMVVIYNGPGQPVWSRARKPQSNGQRVIALSTLAALDRELSDHVRLTQHRPAPI